MAFMNFAAGAPPWRTRYATQNKIQSQIFNNQRWQVFSFSLCRSAVRLGWKYPLAWVMGGGASKSVRRLSTPGTRPSTAASTADGDDDEEKAQGPTDTVRCAKFDTSSDFVAL